MKGPNKKILLNCSFWAFLISAITATRSAHRNIDTQTAIGKTDRS